jgi:hypothetical protein
MRSVVSGLRASIPALWMVVLFLGAGQMLAATCSQPEVSFHAGRLSVTSKGCSLQQVMKAVSQETGIESVVPPSASSVPVFAVVGPGNPAHVISELLEGSAYNTTLTAKADGSGALVRVVLTDRVAFVPDKLPPAPQHAATPGLGHGTQVAHSSASGPQADKKKRTVDPDTVASATDSGEYRPRREIDDETLKKMPKLPQGIPNGMWQLYPQLVDNGGVVPSGPPLLPNGRPAPASSLINPAQLQSAALYPYDPAFAPKGVVGLPELPPNIDPNIGKLYPWNLMQLIQSPIQLPNLHLPPMAKPIINH